MDMARDRIQLEPNGDLDEVVVTGGYAHVERCSASLVFAHLVRPDGSSVAIWFTAIKGRIHIAYEERAARPAPAPDGEPG